jgi:hypothetical protein
MLIDAPKSMVAATFPKEKDRADELWSRGEEIVVELDSESREEVRLATLAWILRSKPGLWVYDTSQWPLLPYLIGAITVFIVILFKDSTFAVLMCVERG